MLVTKQNFHINFDRIAISDYWSKQDKQEIKMHKIHAYPAKFPSLVVSKSIKYAQKTGLNVDTVADIFCGCGTTALEAKLNGIDFWGCDINPVATLIAKTKSQKYEPDLIKKYNNAILEIFDQIKISNSRFKKNERISYWFDSKHITDLDKLLTAIKHVVPNGKYKDYYLCAFSNILKSCSRWLTKSIKPQVDPNKVPRDVKEAFQKQINFMLHASEEAEKYILSNKSKIVNKNFLNLKFNYPFADLLVTSPPYATSYEYADLHQLSALWLEYTDDFRKLRKGTIGSMHDKSALEKDIKKINSIGLNIYNRLFELDKSKARSVARYFIDIEKTVQRAHKLLRDKSLLIFVIGNTKYKNVSVDNAKYLIQCLMDNNFGNIHIYKRKIGSKSLTPYRDEIGKFSSNKSHQKIYAHEFVITATKKSKNISMN